MGAVLPVIDEALAAWIAAQHVFFVASAPLSADGRVNCSPRGMDSLRVLGPDRLAWVDLTGSGIETISHLRENGRITLMWCAFTGDPRIVRVHGRGIVHLPEDGHFAALAALLPMRPGVRALVEVRVERISTSCGFAVPFYDYVGERTKLDEVSQRKGPDGLAAYRAAKNRVSIDGLPGLDPSPSRAP